MTTIDTTLASYDVVTGCTADDRGTAARYRDRGLARIVARHDRDNVLSGIEVVVTWGGHEGRVNIDGEYTITELTDNAADDNGLLAAISEADFIALTRLIRAATDAYTEAINHNLIHTDYRAVRDIVAATIGAGSPLEVPDTESAADEWLRAFDAPDFFRIVIA